MAISITGVTPSPQAVQVAAIQPKIAQAESKTPETTSLDPSSIQASAGMQLKPGKPESPASKTTKTQHNQQRTDTVELSVRAKARMLRDKGRPVFEIAVIMNLDAKTVSSYLGATTQSAQMALKNDHTPATSQQPSSPAEASSENSAEKQQGMVQDLPPAGNK